MANTPLSQCKGPWFDPWSGTWIPNAASKTQQSQKNKNKTKPTQKLNHAVTTVSQEASVSIAAAAIRRLDWGWRRPSRRPAQVGGDFMLPWQEASAPYHLNLSPGLLECLPGWLATERGSQEQARKLPRPSPRRSAPSLPHL